MMTFDEVLASLDTLQSADLTLWIEQNWVLPLREGDLFHFTDADFARVRFLCDMRYDLEIAEDTIPVVLSLLDQVHDLRRQLKSLARAIEAQPEEVRASIAEAVGKRDGESGL